MDDLKTRMKIGRTAIIIALSLCALLAFHGYTKLAVAFVYSPEWPKAWGNVIKSYVIDTHNGSGYFNFFPKVFMSTPLMASTMRETKYFFLKMGEVRRGVIKKSRNIKSNNKLRSSTIRRTPAFRYWNPGAA